MNLFWFVLLHMNRTWMIISDWKSEFLNWQMGLQQAWKVLCIRGRRAPQQSDRLAALTHCIITLLSYFLIYTSSRNRNLEFIWIQVSVHLINASPIFTLLFSSVLVSWEKYLAAGCPTVSTRESLTLPACCLVRIVQWAYQSLSAETEPNSKCAVKPKHWARSCIELQRWWQFSVGNVKSTD